MAEWIGGNIISTSSASRNDLNDFEEFLEKNIEEETVRILRGDRDDIQKRLNSFLGNGWYIPQSESMKVEKDIYSILILKGEPNVRKYI